MNNPNHMKKNVNTLILLVTLMGSIFPVFAEAQQLIAPSVKQQRSSFPVAVERLLHKAGFGNEINSLHQPAQPRSTTLQLDSTITFIGYDLNGDSIPLTKTVYTYPEANTKLEISYQLEGDEWTPLNHITTIYDENDRIVEVVAQAYDSLTSSFVNDSKIETYYHLNSATLLDSFSVSQWSPDMVEWVVQLSTWNIFDSEDRIIESNSSIGFLGEPILFKDKYLYDDKGDNHLIESSAIIEGEEIITGLTENTFMNHLLSVAVVYTTDGINFFPETRETFLYAPFGFIARHTMMVWNEEIENWQIAQTIDYQYDEEHRLSEKFITFYEDGIPADAERPSYEYVKGLYLALETTYLFDTDSQTWLLDNKKYYYYNEVTSIPNEPVQLLALPLAPNPTTRMVKIEIAEPSAIQLFDASGRMIASQILHPGEMIDLGLLPAGLYQLVAQNETGNYSGRILKL
jgi:hypothetical protein